MGQILWKGAPTELNGPTLKVGDKAPSNFTVIANDMSVVKGSDMAGKARIILTSPSLDTPVCDTEARKFNEQAGQIGTTLVYFVTRDLPFAQKRWCGAAGVERVKTLSDYKDRNFGSAWGVEAVSKGLLARAVFVVDKNDVIKHVEYVKETTTEPDYDAALKAARALS